MITLPAPNGSVFFLAYTQHAGPCPECGVWGHELWALKISDSQRKIVCCQECAGTAEKAA